MIPQYLNNNVHDLANVRKLDADIFVGTNHCSCKASIGSTNVQNMIENFAWHIPYQQDCPTRLNKGCSP